MTVVAGCGACTAGPAVVNVNGGSEDAGPRYADALISLQLASGALTECDTTLPDCAAGTPQPGSCGQSPVLGPPDGVDLTLNSGDVLEIEFYCDGYITAQPDGGDFEIYGAVSGGSAVVEVSQDGVTFAPVGILVEAPQTFSLSQVPTDEAKFVRLTGRSGGGVAIDSVEAF